jgi:hypothetical protein
MTKLYTLLLLSTFYLVACKSASKSYQKGDYADAIEMGVKQLQRNPNDGETREIVQNAYNFAVKEREAQIRALSNSNDDSRFEKMYQQYYRLQDLYQTIHSYPAAARLIKTTDYSEYVETYRNKVAEVYVARANEWLNEASKNAYRNAYTEIKSALRYQPNNIQLQKKRDSIFEEAVTKVLLLPAQNFNRYSYASSYQLQNFQDDILRRLNYEVNNEFVKFYSERQARNSDIEPDEVLELNFNGVTIGRPYDRTSTRNVSKKVVVKETVYKSDSVVKEYATVNAKINTTERTLLSEADLMVIIRDPQGRIIWNDRFTGQHQWRTEFANYTGDERALSDSDKNLLNRNDNRQPPREEDIMQELYRQIQSDLSSRLRNYYSRY